MVCKLMERSFNPLSLLNLTAEEVANLQPMTDELLMEAAMCLWEAFIELEGSEQHGGPLGPYRDKIGTVAVRHDLMNLVEPLHIGWRIHELAAGDAVACPFDWEFTPWFLENCVEFHAEGYAVLNPTWEQQCRALRGAG